MIDQISENTDIGKLINGLVSDQKKFNDFVYTPIDKALTDIKIRKNDRKLDEYINSHLSKIPPMMGNGIKAVLFRNITSPNFETQWFTDVITTFRELEPLFLEYTQDKFTNRNECKFALAKLLFYKGKNKKNEPIFESKNVIDINDSNCKPMSSIKTMWGQSLVDFHHDLFLSEFPNLKDNIFDFSEWVQEHGKTAKEYYKIFLLLFIKHGILFENFIFKSKELGFTKEVILPVFIDILKETGMKPLIVALEPPEIEDGHFWQAYSEKSEEIFKIKLSTTV